MKNNYLSEREFHSKCPCGYNLTSYIETLVPPKTLIDFSIGTQSTTDENTYTVTYDVLSSDGKVIGSLEASCTMLPDHNCQYQLIHKNGNF